MTAGVTGTLRKDGKSEYTYKMDVCQPTDVTESDHVDEFGELGIVAVVDEDAYPMLVGLELDYSFELVGGGVRHYNPNSKTNCGCGKSFKL